MIIRATHVLCGMTMCDDVKTFSATHLLHEGLYCIHTCDMTCVARRAVLFSATNLLHEGLYCSVQQICCTKGCNKCVALNSTARRAATNVHEGLQQIAQRAATNVLH